MGFYVIQGQYDDGSHAALRKRYEVIEGKLTTTRVPNCSLHHTFGYSDEDITLEEIASVYDLEEDICVIANGFPPGQSWRRGMKGGDKGEVEEQPRNWALIDLDYNRNPLKLSAHTHSPSQLAKAWLSMAGLPPISFLAARSSSAYVKPEELRLHIWVLLEEPMYSEEIKRLFKDVPLPDRSPLRPNQLIFTQLAEAPPEHIHKLAGPRYEICER